MRERATHNHAGHDEILAAVIREVMIAGFIFVEIDGPFWHRCPFSLQAVNPLIPAKATGQRHSKTAYLA
jgi:hypothetical protein